MVMALTFLKIFLKYGYTLKSLLSERPHVCVNFWLHHQIIYDGMIKMMVDMETLQSEQFKDGVVWRMMNGQECGKFNQNEVGIKTLTW